MTTKDRLILAAFLINILVCFLCAGCGSVQTQEEDPCFWDYDDKPECWDREPTDFRDAHEDWENPPTTCSECITDAECEALCPAIDE